MTLRGLIDSISAEDLRCLYESGLSCHGIAGKLGTNGGDVWRAMRHYKIPTRGRHMGYGTLTWSSWSAMRKRCLSTGDPAYPNYGGRGITIDPRWDSFPEFLSDMGERPGPEYSIGRINNDGGYSKGNCRWELPEQQDNNKRTNVFLEHDGQRLTISQWAKKLAINPITLGDRLRRGWPAAKALSNKSFKGNNDHNMFHVVP